MEKSAGFFIGKIEGHKFLVVILEKTEDIDNNYHVYSIFRKTAFIILLICYNDICDMRKANNIMMYWARRN